MLVGEKLLFLLANQFRKLLLNRFDVLSISHLMGVPYYGIVFWNWSCKVFEQQIYRVSAF